MRKGLEFASQQMPRTQSQLGGLVRLVGCTHARTHTHTHTRMHITHTACYTWVVLKCILLVGKAKLKLFSCETMSWIFLKRIPLQYMQATNKAVNIDSYPIWQEAHQQQTQLRRQIINKLIYNKTN